jgi:outer membrane lipoprotein-sorting protein
MVMEAVPPDSFHTTVQASSGTIETVSVKGQTRYRMNMPGAPTGWQCRGGPPVQAPRDPSKDIQGTVEISRGADTAIEGMPVHTYIYTITPSATGQGGTGKTTLYVGTQTGLPRRSVVSSPGGESTLDFYDYGANIIITLPACGQS